MIFRLRTILASTLAATLASTLAAASQKRFSQLVVEIRVQLTEIDFARIQLLLPG